MENNNKRKYVALGMPYGTASAKLRKTLMFDLLRQLGKLECFRCGLPIDSEIELSIDHIDPWLKADDPVKSFFDLSNISFSHLSCNIRAGDKYNKLLLPEDEKKLRRLVMRREAASRRRALKKSAPIQWKFKNAQSIQQIS